MEEQNGPLVEYTQTLTELPSEILLKILSYLDYQDHLRFCLTAERLKNVHTVHIMHLHQVCTRDGNCTNRTQPEICAVFNILQYTIEYYIFSGYESRYSNGLKPLYNLLQNADAMPEIDNVCAFITQFYMHIESQAASNAMHLDILNICSIFNLLNKFKTFKVLKFVKDNLQWQVSIEVKGRYMGFMKFDKRSATDKRNALFHMVSKLLHSDMLGIPVEKGWHLKKGIYVFGTKQSSRIIFNYGFNTDDSVVLDILKPALCSKNEPKTNPIDKLEPGVKSFNVDVSIECRAALSSVSDKKVFRYHVPMQSEENRN